MSTWSPEQVDTIGAAKEIRLAPLSNDGTPHTPVTIWVVRVDDRVFVRSLHGRSGNWFRRVSKTGQAVLRVGDSEWAVEVSQPAEDVDAAIDEGYRTKYSGRTASINSMIAEGPRAATLELLPL